MRILLFFLLIFNFYFFANAEDLLFKKDDNYNLSHSFYGVCSDGCNRSDISRWYFFDKYNKEPSQLCSKTKKIIDPNGKRQRILEKIYKHNPNIVCEVYCDKKNLSQCYRFYSLKDDIFIDENIGKEFDWKNKKSNNYLFEDFELKW